MNKHKNFESYMLSNLHTKYAVKIQNSEKISQKLEKSKSIIIDEKLKNDLINIFFD